MDQKSIRIASKMKLPRQHPKMLQKVPNLPPKWTQVGAMLKRKIVLDPSKGSLKSILKAKEEKGRGPERPGEPGTPMGGQIFPKCPRIRGSGYI